MIHLKRMVKLITITGLLLIGTSSYAADCKSASVKTIGILPSLESTTATKYIATFTCNDTEPVFTTQQYILSTDLGDSGYATLLTAASLKQTVYVRVAGVAWRSLATLLYLNDTPVP
ncbi:MAG: hypothetical protein D3922_09645 [Candidatus Electrothrix sp. AR1]|nr:hypothetical protein [Candidatus Electrothrix sp. AR1]